jgi:hypothetical protein
MTVIQYRFPRPFSDRGVIEDSIDTPHGDQVPLKAATTATPKAAIVNISMLGPI